LLRKCSHIDYQYWVVLKDLHALYAPHFLYSSEVDYKEPKPKVVNEPDPESLVLFELDILEESGSEVIAELELVPEPEPEVEELETEVEELLIRTLLNLPAEFTMEILPSSPAMRIPVSLRLPDLYDPLQIFLQETESHEIRLFRV